MEKTMADIRLEKWADLLVNYSIKVKPGERVLLRGDWLAEPLIKATYAKILEAGGFPFVVVDIPETREMFFKLANEAQLAHVSEPLKLAMSTYECMIRIIADENTHALSHVDPAKVKKSAQAGRVLQEIYMQRAATGDLRWSLTAYPTQAYAQDADMSLAEYTEFIYGAVMPDANDPIGYWKGVSARQDRIVAWLKGKKNVHLVGKGTDLRLSIAGREFINCDCQKNVPDGEVFTGPVEDSMEGHVTFSYPTIYQGREVTGVQLDFKQGKVVKASAEKNEAFLLETLDTDEGSRYVGEFAIGTNEGIKQFTRQILFDEKIGGSFHMALGAGYPETGSKARSAIHWDMICDLRDGGQIWVDDVLFYENGKFKIEA
jgi:Leucyl aminopeptidase (aminopeptidase T)